MSIAHITTHELDAAKRFIDQYKDLPRLTAWLASYVRRVQELENAAWDVLIKRQVGVAKDAQLDTLGKLVGEARQGLSDEAYRIRILTRISANSSLGRPRDIIATGLLSIEQPAWGDLAYYEVYPASWVLEAFSSSVDPMYIAEVLRTASPAGVGGSLHLSDWPREQTFCFSMTDFEEPDTARGFGNDDGSPPGGAWIGTY